MGHTLVCFALKEEAEPFRRTAAGTTEISVLITGIGRKNTEDSFSAIIKGGPPVLVLTCGFAGALGPDLRAGDVVFSTEDTSLREKLLAAGAKHATFFCAPRIATTASEKQELRRRTGADAVEMESETIHVLCREQGIPCATVRVILDTADEDLPLDFNQLAKPDWSMDYGKLARAVAKSPGKIGALLRLQRRTRQCAIRLGQALGAVTQSIP